MATKMRIHREWFRTVSLGNRKSCPNCKETLPQGEKIWSWGQYVRAKWQTIQYCCGDCFPTDVIPRLREHAAGCGCTFALEVKLGFDEVRPAWLTLEEPIVSGIPETTATNITEAHKDAFEMLVSAVDNFALFSCFVNGEPAAAICLIIRNGDEFDVRPMFVSVTPGMVLKDHNGEMPN